MAVGKMKMTYFGPKDPVTGERPEEPPPYYHQPLPCWLYHKQWPGWPRDGRMFDNEKAVEEALADGWMRNPMEAGINTEPSQAQMLAQQEAEFTQRKAGEQSASDSAMIREREEQEFQAWKAARAKGEKSEPDAEEDEDEPKRGPGRPKKAA